MSQSKRSQAHFAIVLACLAIVYYMGVTELTAKPMSWASEWHSLKHLYNSHWQPSFTLAETLKSVSERSEDHGPLYFIILSAWRDIFGRDLATYRLLSLYFGLIAVAFTYRLALLSRDEDLALAAVVIVSFLSLFVYFTYKVRMYSLLSMLVPIVAWQYWRIAQEYRRVRWWNWLTLIVSSAAIVAVHYFGVLLLAAIGIYHLLFAPKGWRWLSVCLAMAAAGLLFSPWLPVVVKAVTIRTVPEDEGLPLIQAVAALIGLYSNGLTPLVPLAIGAIALGFRRLSRFQRYLLLLAGLTTLFLLLGNELTPLLIARRLRYTIILAIPWACIIAIALSLMPGRRIIQLLFAGIWIAAFFIYNDSFDFRLYTNRITTSVRQDEFPHYQDFHYEAARLPGHNELILSFHPSGRVSSRVIDHYRTLLKTWKHVVHISYDAAGELVIQSNLSTFRTPDAISSNAVGVWVLHNPQQTELDSLPVYRDWFAQEYRHCHRFFETNDSVIDYYLKPSIPCEVVTGEEPFAVRYDNGTELGNMLVEEEPETITFFLWWRHSIGKDYAYSIQIFDEQGEKLRQIDHIISDEPIDVFAFDIASLPAADYVARLIVYDSETIERQPGMVLSNGHRIERMLDIARFSVEE